LIIQNTLKGGFRVAFFYG